MLGTDPRLLIAPPARPPTRQSVRQVSLTSHGETDEAAYSDTDSNGRSSSLGLNKKRPWTADEDEHLRYVRTHGQRCCYANQGVNMTCGWCLPAQAPADPTNRSHP